MAELIPLKESVPRNRVPTIMNALRFGLWCCMPEWGRASTGTEFALDSPPDLSS
jgi:hypothetical protein